MRSRFISLFCIGLLFSGGAMANSNYVHHGIDYIEFAVMDLAKAKSFYSSTFGWKFNDYGPSYAGIQKENGEAGGLRLDKSVVTGGFAGLQNTPYQDTFEFENMAR